MLEGIAFLAIVTAAITSTFVARAERASSEESEAKEESSDTARIDARLDALDRKLDEIAAAIRGSSDT